MVSEKQVLEFLKFKDQVYISNLINLLYDDTNLGDSVSICLYCGPVSVKKNGKGPNGNQRYYCNDCHKLFNERTGTISY